MNNWNQPSSLKQFDLVTVEGTGYLDVATDGHHKYRLVIASCKLTEKQSSHERATRGATTATPHRTHIRPHAREQAQVPRTGTQ